VTSASAPLPIRRADDRNRVTAHLAREALRIGLAPDAARGTDVVVVLADRDYVDHRPVEREARWILDCRNRMSDANAEIL
jgi:hypothetical protein